MRAFIEIRFAGILVAATAASLSSTTIGQELIAPPPANRPAHHSAVTNPNIRAAMQSHGSPAASANVPLVIIGSPITYSPAQLELQAADVRRRSEQAAGAFRLRQLDNEIRLAQAEVDSLRRIGSHYSKFNRVSNDGGPLLLTRETFKLELLSAELRLKELKDERFYLQRRLSDERRLHSLQRRDAAERAALELPPEAPPLIVVE